VKKKWKWWLMVALVVLTAFLIVTSLIVLGWGYTRPGTFLAGAGLLLALLTNALMPTNTKRKKQRT
jgi:uncharacterized membrane protein YgaE (UPF0421/DUF939 family)